MGKESACNAGDPGSIPGSGRPPGEGKGYPLQYSGLENFIDCIGHDSDFHFRSAFCWQEQDGGLEGDVCMMLGLSKEAFLEEVTC